MTDNLISEVAIETCKVGHVHLSLVTTGGGCEMHGIFTPREAYDLARLLIRCAYEADNVLQNLPGIAGGDVGPCTRH